MVSLRGDRLASGSLDGTIRLWNLADAVELAVLAGHLQSVTSLLPLPNGWLASASGDRTVRLWDTEAFCEVAVLVKHMVRVVTLCTVWPDSTTWLLASVGDEGAIRLWDVEAREEVVGLCGRGSGKVSALVAPFQGRLVTATAGGAIDVWDTAQPASDSEALAPMVSVEKAHGKAVSAVVALPSGFVVTGSQDFSIKMWDITDLKQEVWDGSHAAPIVTLATTPSGRLASGSADGIIKLWDLPRRTPAVTFHAADSAVRAMLCCAMPSGALAFGASADSAIHIWDVGEGVHVELGQLYGHKAIVTVLKSLPNGLLVSGDVGGSLKLWDVTSATSPQHERFPLACLQGPRVAVEDVCSIPEGGILVGWRDASMKVLDDETLSVVTDLPSRAVHAMVVLSGQRGVATGGPEDTAVTVSSLSGRGQPLRLQGHGDHVLVLAELPGAYVASGSRDNTIKVWDLSVRTCVRTLSGHRQYLVALDLLPDGHLISASHDNQVKVWDWQAGSQLVDMSAQNWGTGSVLSALAATKSYQGGWIATSRTEKTIRVWAHVGAYVPSVVGGATDQTAKLIGNEVHIQQTVDKQTAQIVVTVGQVEDKDAANAAAFAVEVEVSA